MTRRRLARLLLLLLALTVAAGWLLPPVTVIRQGDTRGVWIGPSDQPFLIVARQDRPGVVWVGGYLSPPSTLGCDWAVCLYDNQGVAAQYHGRLYELLPPRKP